MQGALDNARVVFEAIRTRVGGAPASIDLCKKLVAVAAGAPVIAFATSFIVAPRSVVHRVFFGAFFTAGMWSTAMLFRVLVVPFILMPAQLVSTMNKDALKEHKGKFLASFRQVASALTIPTEDGVALDAVLIRNNPSGVEPAKRPWILWFNTNGVCLEENLGFADVYARTIGANVLVFNYRGVGESTGQIIQFSDMLIDARAAFKYLLESEGALPERILLHGHSMGAAVAVMLRREYPDGPIVHDRSFGSLTAVVEAKLNGDMKLIGLAVMVFAALAASVWNAVTVIFLRFPQGQAGVFLLELLALVVGVLHIKQITLPYPALYAQKQRLSYGVAGLVGFAALAYIFFGRVPFAVPFVSHHGVVDMWLHILEASLLLVYGGVALHFGGGSVWAIKKFLQAAGWEANIVEDWRKIRGSKLVLYHKFDQMIDYESSLHKMTNQDDEPDTSCVSLELLCPPGFRNFHMFELCRFGDLWSRVANEVRRLLVA